MTENEAKERARLIWGNGAIASVAPVQYVSSGRPWWIEVVRQASVHFLDHNGHVACRHDSCLLLERRADFGV